MIKLLYTLTIGSIALYVIFSGLTLPAFGWAYVGGGGEWEKIHPATYLLTLLVPSLALSDRPFRKRSQQLVFSPIFLFFIVAVGSASFYGIVIKGVSAAPFVDSLYSTALITVVGVAMPQRRLLQLRSAIDLTVLFNAFLVFVEFVTQQSIQLRFYTGPMTEIIGPIRWTGMLGMPLSAAQILAAYSLCAMLSSLNSRNGGIRFCYAIFALAACLLTGGRTSALLGFGLMMLAVLGAAYRRITRGSISKMGLVYFLVGSVALVLAVPVIFQIGLLDTLFARFDYDYGSAMARDAAIQILQNLSWSDLWFGVGPSDVASLQESYGLLAIEIAWANFILICGLLFTVPLFVAFCLYLFVILPRYCSRSIILFGVFTLALTFAYNSIWSKTTVFAISVAAAISCLRRDMLFSRELPGLRKLAPAEHVIRRSPLRLGHKSGAS